MLLVLETDTAKEFRNLLIVLLHSLLVLDALVHIVQLLDHSLQVTCGEDELREVQHVTGDKSGHPEVAADKQEQVGGDEAEPRLLVHAGEEQVEGVERSANGQGIGERQDADREHAGRVHCLGGYEEVTQVGHVPVQNPLQLLLLEVAGVDIVE